MEDSKTNTMKATKGSVFYFTVDNLKTKQDTEKGEYRVEGYISTPDIDLVNDIMTVKCQEDMTRQVKSGRVKLDYEHETLRAEEGESEQEAEYNKALNPLGRITDGYLDENGSTYVTAVLNPNWKKTDPQGNVVKTFSEVWEEIEDGFLDGFSVAFVPEQVREGEKQGTPVRYLDKVRLINVAMTGNPIQQSATLTGYGIREAMAKSLKFMEGRKMSEDLQKRQEELSKEVQDLKNTIQDLKASMVSNQESNQEEQDTSEFKEVKSLIENLKSEFCEVRKNYEDLKSRFDEPIIKGQETHQSSNQAEQGQESVEQKGQREIINPLDLF